MNVTSANNIAPAVVYFAVRWSEDATWLNDRDQFLYPHTDPLQDEDFINDCLVFSIFHGNNHISVTKGDNHWIPFSESQLGVNTKPFDNTTIYDCLTSRNIPDNLSEEARGVYDTGLKIFHYYHTGNNGKPFQTSLCGKFKYNVDAALYDIRQFFQSTNDKGHMKVKSEDKYYQSLIVQLRANLIRVSQLSRKSHSQCILNGRFNNSPILLINRRIIKSSSKVFTH